MIRSLGRRLHQLERRHQVPVTAPIGPPSRQLLFLIEGMVEGAVQCQLDHFQAVFGGVVGVLHDYGVRGRTGADFEAACGDFLAVATAPVVVVGRTPTLDEQLAGFMDNVDRLEERLRELLP